MYVHVYEMLNAGKKIDSTNISKNYIPFLSSSNKKYMYLLTYTGKLVCYRLLKQYWQSFFCFSVFPKTTDLCEEIGHWMGFYYRQCWQPYSTTVHVYAYIKFIIVEFGALICSCIIYPTFTSYWLPSFCVSLIRVIVQGESKARQRSRLSWRFDKNRDM